MILINKRDRLDLNKVEMKEKMASTTERKEYIELKKGIERLMKMVIRDVEDYPLQRALLSSLLELREKLDGRKRTE